jgi:hypothetical protein
MSRSRMTRPKFVCAVALIAAALASAPAASAFDTRYPPDGDHPLRIAYTFVYPAGKILEYTVTRPIAILGNYIAPYDHIDARGFRGCSRERPARSCTDVVK